MNLDFCRQSRTWFHYQEFTIKWFSLRLSEIYKDQNAGLYSRIPVLLQLEVRKSERPYHRALEWISSKYHA